MNTPRPSRLLATAALLAGLAGASAAHALDLQGHRGARGLAPENSLAGFELALQQGVTTVELDIAITRDGVLVIHHDLELNPNHTRDAQGRWLDKPSAPIFHMSWDELQAYDIGRIRPGTSYARQFPDQQPADGTRVPRLADLFARVKALGNERIRFAIETKVRPDSPAHTLPPEAYATAVVNAVRQAGMAGRVQILSFDWRTLQVVQRIAPEIPTVYLTAQQRWTDNVGAHAPEGSAWTAGFQHKDHGSVPKMIKAAGGRFWSVYHGDLTPERLAEAQGLGLKVLVWTVNDAAQMGRFVDMGVDGLVTDRPDIAQRVLQERRVTPR